jgi:hypothetical protein
MFSSTVFNDKVFELPGRPVKNKGILVYIAMNMLITFSIKALFFAIPFGSLKDLIKDSN